MTREADAVALLGRALRASARSAGLHVTVERERSRPWTSATFVGEMIEADLSVIGTGADDWLAGLTETDLSIRGWYVADL